MSKENKSDVFYTVTPDTKGRTCSGKKRCVNFHEVPGAGGDGTCDKVHGIIVQDAHCDLWESATPPRKKPPPISDELRNLLNDDLLGI